MADYGKNNEPPHWFVTRIPRTNIKYIGKIDWYYYEPGTGIRFRSRKKAWLRYHDTKKKKTFENIIRKEVSLGNKITEAEKKEVEDFLHESRMNLMNLNNK